MKAEYISYRDTQSFSSGLLSYLEKAPELAPFYAYPANLDGFRQIINQKKVKADRQTLVKVLHEQYQGISLSVSVAQNLESLLQENTYTVTTGHQLNLFTGPLYFIYKIATAIKLARDLKAAFPDRHFVPVYWMATEDHDFAEINHTYSNGHKITWQQENQGATGRLSTEDLAETLKTYQRILGASPDALQLAQWVEEAYAGQANLADATRCLVNKLFKAYGLVIIDADHPELKKQFAAVVTQDIIGQHSYREISQTNSALKTAGIEAPVNPREINFFYLKDGLRERIVQKGSTYEVLSTGIRFSEAELKQEINTHPEHFSPNVVMRPLYQESILPNIAYIGGGAEILYWLELKSTFDHYGIDYPVLLLRNSAQLVYQQLMQQLKRLGLSLGDLFKPEQEIQKAWLLRKSDQNLNLNDSLDHINQTFEQLKKQAGSIDPTLVASTEAIKVRLTKALGNLEKKFIKAEKRKHAEAMAKIEKLKASFFPNGGLQERSENFGPYYALYGQAFIEQLISDFKPLDFQFTLLTLPE
jgi:bacillithiol biosynthesis cysteine-adding enzyme BshC